MADKPPVLHEYEVELRPGVRTTLQLSDVDAEKMGLTDKPDGVEVKARAAGNKARTAENKS